MNYFTVLQYIPRNMHTVFALLCFVVSIHWLIVPYPSGLLHWHCGNLTIAPVPAKQPWWIWIHTSCELIMNDCITTTKQSTTKTCAYFLRYTVFDGGYYGATIKHGKFFWSDDTKEKLKPLMETETQRVLISIVIVPSPCYIVRICESHSIVFLMGKSWSWYHMAISFYDILYMYAHIHNVIIVSLIDIIFFNFRCYWCGYVVAMVSTQWEVRPYFEFIILVWRRDFTMWSFGYKYSDTSRQRWCIAKLSPIFCDSVHITYP